jgi:ABC-type lipoprotein release transport system permease subunit
MLLKIAWRNLWRTKWRSLIIICSIVIGVVGLVLSDVISIGFLEQMLRNQVEIHPAHIQIHQKGFHNNPSLDFLIANSDSVESILGNHPGVAHFSRRVIAYGLVSSVYNSSGVSIIGIEPSRETQITIVNKSMVRGEYLKDEERSIILSEETADKLKLDVGDKVVIMAARRDGTIGSEALRITGIYKTYDAEFDKTHIFVPISVAQEMLLLGRSVSEVVMLLNNTEQIDEVKSKLVPQLSQDLEVLTYNEIMPMLQYQIELYDKTIYILYAIIGIAMVFGIINVMLMAVYERMQEFGILMAIGMQNRLLFRMVMLEALLLGLTGTVIGLVLGYCIYYPFSVYGIDFSVVSETMSSFGVAAVIYPIFKWTIILNVLLSVPLFALLGAIYPALKAVRFQPVEVIRQV